VADDPDALRAEISASTTSPIGAGEIRKLDETTELGAERCE
jgi:hypothetical protein